LARIKRIHLAAVWERLKQFAAVNACVIALVAFSVGLVIGFNARSLRSLFHEPLHKPTVYSDDINDYGKRLLKEARASGTFVFDQYGMALEPGGTATIEYNFSKGPEQEVKLQLWFYTPLQGASRLEVASGGKVKLLLYNPRLTGLPPLDLTDVLHGDTSFTLRLQAMKERGATQPRATVFDRITLTIADPLHVPPLDSMTAIVLCAIYMWRLGLWLRLRKQVVLAACVSLLVVLSWLQFGAYPHVRSIAAVAFWASFLACILTYFRRNTSRALPSLTLLLLPAIVYIGVAQRWQLLASLAGSPLEVFAINYRDTAAGMRGLFDSHYREPLFIWCVKIFFVALYSGEVPLRLCTFVLSVTTLPVLYFVGKKLFTPLVGLLAAFFFATNASMIESSVRGLRGEAFILTILAFIAYLFRKPEKFTVKHAVLLGLLAGLNDINNLSFLSITAPLIIIVGVVRRRKLGLILLSLAVSFIIVLPHLVHNKREFGDYFYTINIHARYYRNLEFGGKPGFPTQDEIERNIYAGSPISTFAYLFKLHSIREVVETSWDGFKKLYFSDYPTSYSFGNSALTLLYIIGVIMLLLSRQRIFLLGLFFAGYGMTFMVGRFFNFDWRLVMHVAPLMYLCAGYGVDTIVQFASAQEQISISALRYPVGTIQEETLTEKNENL
jgi:hypothetical protein